MIKELARLHMPTHADVLVTLQAYRYNMTGGSRHVWLTVSDERGWNLVDDQRQLEGAYARCTIGKADSNLALHDAATTMIAAIRDYIDGIPS